MHLSQGNCFFNRKKKKDKWKSLTLKNPLQGSADFLCKELESKSLWVGRPVWQSQQGVSSVNTAAQTRKREHEGSRVPKAWYSWMLKCEFHIIFMFLQVLSCF